MVSWPDNEEDMREKKQTEQVVINHSTGHAEADMLGNILIWVERLNRPPSHKIHSKQLKKYSFLSRSEVARLSSSGHKVPQTSFWRRIKSLISYSNKYGRRLAKVMRNKRVNGK